MCHCFLPVPLSPGATMRIRGQGPFLRASIHISGPGRVQSARVYRHTGIHIYMHTPAHRGAAGRPQGSRLRPNAGAGPFCGPWHTPCAAANSVSGPTGRASVATKPVSRPPQGQAQPRCSGAMALPTAPTKPRVAPCSPWRGCSRVGIRRHTCPVGVRPCAFDAAHPSDVMPPSRTPRGTLAASERPGAAATKAANRWQIPAWFGRDAGAAPIPARARLRPLPKENVK